MNKWSAVVLFLDTCVFIKALYVDSRCYSRPTFPCHRHRLICNEGNSNWKIAITEAKYGFKTSLCDINGCDLSCCKEELGDCFEPFSKTPSIQKLLYDTCEFEKECKLDDPHRMGGCNGGRSTYSRIEYDCIEETDILRTTGSKNQKFVSLLFNGSDPKFPDAGISCSIRTNGFLEVTNYYTRLAGDRSGDAESEFFDATDCTTGYKLFIQNNDGPKFMCHNGGEFFYTHIYITESSINLNLVINSLDDNDVIWLGLFDPLLGIGNQLAIDCTNLNRSEASRIASETRTTESNTNIGTEGKEMKCSRSNLAGIIGGTVVGLVLLNIIVIIIVVLIFRRKLRSKQTTDETQHYSSLDGLRNNTEHHYSGIETTSPPRA